MENKFGPCMEKKCSVCCNPVKVDRGMPDGQIPRNKQGKKIWKRREDELWAPEDEWETRKLEVYDCDNYDVVTGKCKDYENRPNICKNTSCVGDKSKGSVDEQHRRFIKKEFFQITDRRGK